MTVNLYFRFFIIQLQDVCVNPQWQRSIIKHLYRLIPTGACCYKHCFCQMHCFHFPTCREWQNMSLHQHSTWDIKVNCERMLCHFKPVSQHKFLSTKTWNRLLQQMTSIWHQRGQKQSLWLLAPVGISLHKCLFMLMSVVIKGLCWGHVIVLRMA